MDNAKRAIDMGCSAELVDGIRRYDARIASLGGYGAAITARTRTGEMLTGRLIERGFGGCQPGIRTSDGKSHPIQLDESEWNDWPVLVSVIRGAQ